MLYTDITCLTDVLLSSSHKTAIKEVKSQKLLKYKPYKYNFILSSLAIKLLQRIQILDFFLGGGRRGGGERDIGVRRMGQVGVSSKFVKLQL